MATTRPILIDFFMNPPRSRKELLQLSPVSSYRITNLRERDWGESRSSMKEPSNRDGNNRELDKPADCVRCHKYAVQLYEGGIGEDEW
jgi:hypothetical protein